MKMLKRIIAVVFLGVLASLQLQAKDGMYLLSDIPELMPQLLIAGCECNGQQLYSADGTSLANQVAHFGRGCSSEIISKNGLLLTNYHCAHGSIQSVSSVEHDYLKKGFWAKNYAEELPVEGLAVKVPIKVMDVTKEVLAQLKGLEGEAKAKKLIEIKAKMVKFEKSKAADISAFIREMLGGTKYVLFVSRIFKDIRLVGVPPSSLGKFGGDRDNWVWPRHTADFTFLRVYADANGNPAAYSKENKPLSTPYHIQVSTKGVEENDFVFILGYPGRTNRYSTSFEVAERQNITNKIRYKVRTEKLKVFYEQMKKNDTIRIKYSSKAAGVSNYWKHAQAQNLAFERINILQQKRDKEAEFMQWVNATPERQQEYGKVFENIQAALAERKDLLHEYMLVREALFGMDIVSFVSGLDNDKYYFDEKNKEGIAARAKRFYKNIDLATETQVVAALLKEYFETTQNNQLPEVKKTIQNVYKGNYAAYAKAIVSASLFKTFDGYEQAVLENKDKEAIQQDKLFQLGHAIHELAVKLGGELKEATKRFRNNQDLYKKGIAESSVELLAPDANSTIRLTYGHVKDLKVDEKTHYPSATTLEGVMKKYNADSAYYELPEEFVNLYKNKDFGRYEVNGTVPTCFLATTHTTGGNSGSPVFDAKGHLVGLLFDGNSEGLSGDYQFDENLVRSVIVDVRYVLFIAEKLGKSSHIINELGLENK